MRIRSTLGENTVNIGNAFESWKDLRFVLDIKTEPKLSFIIMDR